MLIPRTIAFVQETLKNAEGGHDWWHIHRVWVNAKRIAASEKVNLEVVELAALLHDIADAKFHNNDDEIGEQVARKFLETEGVSAQIVEQVCYIIRHISFKGGKENPPEMTAELAVVQDADRLDAIGAIGIARAFNYGGFKGRALYNPEIAPDLNMDKSAYRNSNAPTINHFYEKLLLLKDRMNTETGKRMAEERHRFMEAFLTQFYAEVGA
jgi:uncharacterized protein